MTSEESRLREQPGGVSWQLQPINRRRSDTSRRAIRRSGGAELSIARRLGDWKTLVSFGFAVLVLVFVVAKGGIDPSAIWARVRTANPFFFVVAVVVYYSTFPIRGYRWKILLQNAFAGARPVWTR